MPEDALSAGIIDLTSYFAERAAPESPPPSDADPPDSHLEGADGATDTQTASDLPSDDSSSDGTSDTSPVSDPLELPEVQAAVQSRVREAIEARERAAREEAQRRYLESLPDDQYGRVMRQHMQNMAREQTALEAAKVTVYQEGLTGAMRDIPELAKLTAEETAKFDPRKFSSFAEFSGALIQHVAEVRAKKLAESVAKTQFEALKASELARMQAEFPSTPRSSSSTPGEIGIDMSQMSGIDLLRASFK